MNFKLKPSPLHLNLCTLNPKPTLNLNPQRTAVYARARHGIRDHQAGPHFVYLMMQNAETIFDDAERGPPSLCISAVIAVFFSLSIYIYTSAVIFRILKYDR